MNEKYEPPIKRIEAYKGKLVHVASMGTSNLGVVDEVDVDNGHFVMSKVPLFDNETNTVVEMTVRVPYDHAVITHIPSMKELETYRSRMQELVERKGTYVRIGDECGKLDVVQRSEYGLKPFISHIGRSFRWMDSRLWIPYDPRNSIMEVNKQDLDVLVEESALRNELELRELQIKIARLRQSHPVAIEAMEISAIKDMPARARTVFAYEGIETVGQLTNYTKKELLGMRRMGHKTYEEVATLLRRHGITLRE